jgi:prevent-host-death family protein
MPSKTISATQFRVKCLHVIDQMTRDHEPVTVTKRGRPVAIVMPVVPKEPISIIGALRGSVLRYDDPFAPAAATSDWKAVV